MRGLFFILAAILMIALSLTQLIACKPSATNQKNSQPIMLEQAMQELKEKGSTCVDTIEKASSLAGYPVAIPAFTPEGFIPKVIENSSTFSVYDVYTLSDLPPSFRGR